MAVLRVAAREHHGGQGLSGTRATHDHAATNEHAEPFDVVCGRLAIRHAILVVAMECFGEIGGRASGGFFHDRERQPRTLHR